MTPAIPPADAAPPPRRSGRARPALPEPFRAGLRPLGDAPWLRDGAGLGALLAERAALHARDPRAVHRRVGDAGEAVDPIFLDALERAGIDCLALVGGALVAAGREAPTGTGPTPLASAALAVAEDLAALVRDVDGWRLAEAFVAAPSAWRLGEKIGRPLAEVHGPVPGFAAGTEGDALVTRMFDALRPGAPVVRGSWSLHADDRRFLPAHAPDHAARLGRSSLEALFLRTERQVLHRLDGGAVLFSIDTLIGRVDALEARELEAQLARLTPAQRAYRGLPERGPYRGGTGGPDEPT